MTSSSAVPTTGVLAGLADAMADVADRYPVAALTVPVWRPSGSRPAGFRIAEWYQWGVVGRKVAVAGVDRAVTTGALGRAWAAGLDRSGADGQPSLVQVVETGIALDDLFAVAPVLNRLVGHPRYPGAVAEGLAWLAQERFPDVPVRDMVGWLLVGDRLGDVEVTQVTDRAARWVTAGMPHGWAFEFAGLSPAEAHANPDAARVLAALAGAPVLAG